MKKIKILEEALEVISYQDEEISELKKQLEEIRFYVPHIDKNVADSNKAINQLQTKLDKAVAILKDFLTTEECRDTWAEEMHSTIEKYLKELK